MWGVLRCAALELPGPIWQGMDSHPATPSGFPTKVTISLTLCRVRGVRQREATCKACACRC